METVVELTQLTGGALAFLVIILLMRGVLVTKLRHDDTIGHYEKRLSDRDIAVLAALEETQRQQERHDRELERQQDRHDRERQDLQQDRDWWKDATVTALNIGETVVDRTLPSDSDSL